MRLELSCAVVFDILLFVQVNCNKLNVASLSAALGGRGDSSEDGAWTFQAAAPHRRRHRISRLPTLLWVPVACVVLRGRRAEKDGPDGEARLDHLEV